MSIFLPSQILKFVLVLFFTWTVVAKPAVILLSHFTRQYYATATSNTDNGSPFGLNETTIYVCTNFWDIGNHIILFISATLTPLVFVCSGKPIPCGQRQEFSLSSKKSTKINGVDRPVTVMGSINDMDIGTFTWDTFTFAPPREKQIALRGLEGVAQKSTTAWVETVAGRMGQNTHPIEKPQAKFAPSDSPWERPVSTQGLFLVHIYIYKESNRWSGLVFPVTFTSAFFLAWIFSPVTRIVMGKMGGEWKSSFSPLVIKIACGSFASRLHRF